MYSCRSGNARVHVGLVMHVMIAVMAGSQLHVQLPGCPESNVQFYCRNQNTDVNNSEADVEHCGGWKCSDVYGCLGVCVLLGVEGGGG